jgi:hypothetical protein
MAATSPSTRLPGPPPSLPPGCRAATGPRGAHQVSGRASHRLLHLSAAAEPDRSASLVADQHLVSLPDRDPSPFLPQALLFHWSRFSPRPDHGSSLGQVCVAAPCLRHHAPASRSTGPPPRHWAAPPSHFGLGSASDQAAAPRHCGLGPESRPSADVVFFFLLIKENSQKMCETSKKSWEIK